jgi:hypothetical protein
MFKHITFFIFTIIVFTIFSIVSVKADWVGSCSSCFTSCQYTVMTTTRDCCGNNFWQGGSCCDPTTDRNCTSTNHCSPPYDVPTIDTATNYYEFATPAPRCIQTEGYSMGDLFPGITCNDIPIAEPDCAATNLSCVNPVCDAPRYADPVASCNRISGDYLLAGSMYGWNSFEQNYICNSDCQPGATTYVPNSTMPQGVGPCLDTPPGYSIKTDVPPTHTEACYPDPSCLTEGLSSLTSYINGSCTYSYGLPGSETGANSTVYGPQVLNQPWQCNDNLCSGGPQNIPLSQKGYCTIPSIPPAYTNITQNIPTHTNACLPDVSCQVADNRLCQNQRCEPGPGTGLIDGTINQVTCDDLCGGAGSSTTFSCVSGGNGNTCISETIGVNDPVVVTLTRLTGTDIVGSQGNRVDACAVANGIHSGELRFRMTATSGTLPEDNRQWSYTINHTAALLVDVTPTSVVISNNNTQYDVEFTIEYQDGIADMTDIISVTVSDGGSAYVTHWANQAEENAKVSTVTSNSFVERVDTATPDMSLNLTTTKSNEITATFGATDIHLVEHQYYCGGVADTGNSSYRYITIQDTDNSSLGNQFSSIFGVNNNCNENTLGAVELNENLRIVNRQFSSTSDNRDIQYTFNTVLTSRDDPFSILFNTGNLDWYAQDSFCNRSYATNPQEREIGAPWMQTDSSVYIYGDSKYINPQDKKKAVQLSIPKVDSSADTFLSKYFFLSNNPSNKLSVDKNSLSKYNLKLTKTPNYLLSAYESTSTQYQTYFDEIADRIFQDANRPVNEFLSNINVIQLFEYNRDISIGDTEDLTEDILNNMSISSSRMYIDNKFQSYNFITSSLDETKKTAIIINGNLNISSTNTPIKYEGVNYILVRGDLTIDADILKQTPSSALQFIVQGDLFIKGGINHSLNLTRNDIPLYDTIQAFFLVDGRVHTYRDNPGGIQVVWDGLNIQGSIVTGQLCPNDRVTLWGETGPINTNEGFYKGEGKAVPMQSNQEPCISHLERDFIMIHNLSYPAQTISFDPTAYLLLNSGIKQYNHTRIIEDAWDGQ